MPGKMQHAWHLLLHLAEVQDDFRAFLERPGFPSNPVDILFSLFRHLRGQDSSGGVLRLTERTMLRRFDASEPQPAPPAAAGGQ